MSLAKYVAGLRHEELHQNVGYAIGNDRQYDEGCKLVFVTTGWLLQKLVFNPDFFHKYVTILYDPITCVTIFFVHQGALTL